MGKTIVIALAGLLVALLAAVLIRFNRKRLHIIKRATSATDAQLERVYRAVESINTETAHVCRAGAHKSDGTINPSIVPVPEYVQPWQVGA